MILLKRKCYSTPSMTHTNDTDSNIYIEDSTHMRINTISILQKLLYNNGIIIDENTFKNLHQMMAESPETFTKIDFAIENIIINEKFDIHDIPQIILAISTVIKNDKILTGQFAIEIIKLFIEAIIDSEVLPFPECEISIIKKIVNSSIELLEIKMPETEQNTVGCFRFFDCIQ